MVDDSVSGKKIRVLRQRLRRAYAQLTPKLARLAGYRVVLHHEAPTFDKAFAHSSSGDLLYRLDSPVAGAFAYLELDKAGAADAFATKIVGRFQTKTKRLFGNCNHTRQIEQTLLREESFFWDDLIVGFKYPKNSHYSLIETLWTLRQGLHFRYEGQLPRIGVLLTWNLATFIEKSGTAIIPLADCPSLDDLLKGSKAAHLLSDAEAAIYVVKGARAVQLMYRASLNPTSDDSGWEFVPSQYRWLRPAVQGRDLVIINSGVGEQILITSKAVLKWVGGQWTRLSHSSVYQLLPPSYPNELKNLLLDIVGQLSQQHVGALIVLPEDLDGLLKTCALGLSQRLNGAGLLKLSPATRGFFQRLCAIDGAVILSSDATVVDAGVIVNIPPGSPAEGARSTAAQAASKFGIAIKVSHDGPITVYRSGQRVASIS